MNFSSDTVSSAAPEILAALARANEGTSPSYGADEISARVEKKLTDIFECELSAFAVGTGTACNALALSVMTPSYGAVLCHKEAHIHTDECGAPEMYTGGAKLIGLPGENGKIAAATLRPYLQSARGVHSVKPSVISLAQAAELGTVYTPSEISDIGSLAKANGLHLHMDGARFANALVSLNASPADLTWKAGVDILSLGATKNGAMGAEVVVCFNKDLAESLNYRRKRAGHLFSKMRFVSAQLDAYFTDDLWLRHARHANQMAKTLAEGLARIPSARLLFPVEANELFVWLPPAMVLSLRQSGFSFYDWPGYEEGTFRLVTAFNTRLEDVAHFVETVEKLSRQAA